MKTNDNKNYNELADKILIQEGLFDEVKKETAKYYKYQNKMNISKINEIYDKYLSKVYKKTFKEWMELYISKSDSKRLSELEIYMNEIKDIKKYFEDVDKYDNLWR